MIVKELDHSAQDTNSIYFLGDIHKNFEVISSYIRHYDIRHSAIVQVGDFGVGFHMKDTEDRMLTELGNLLSGTNNRLYAIRGNHDTPSYFVNGSDYPNICFIEDYTVLTLKRDGEPKRILCVGGAISIDRMTTKPLGKWREGEEVVFHKDLEFERDDINIMITHTAPSFAFPVGSNRLVEHFIAKEPALREELLEERKSMAELFYDIVSRNPDTLADYFYGHFHNSMTMPHDNVYFHLLDINELQIL